MTKKLLTLLFIFKIHILSKVYGKVLPIHDIDASQEQTASENTGIQKLIINNGSETQESSNEFLENLDIIEDAQLIDSDIISQLRDKKLSKFLELIEEAGVINTFSNRKGYPITVFAPENEAFQSDNGQELKERRFLQSMVFSHLLFGEVYYEDLVNDEILQTIGGSSIVIQTEPEFTINGHLVLEQVLASNGVIYVLSTFLVSPYVEEFTSNNTLPQWAKEYPPPPRSTLAEISTSENSGKVIINQDGYHTITETETKTIEYHTITETEYKEVTEYMEVPTYITKTIEVTVNDAIAKYKEVPTYITHTEYKEVTVTETFGDPTITEYKEVTEYMEVPTYITKTIEVTVNDAIAKYKKVPTYITHTEYKEVTVTVTET